MKNIIKAIIRAFSFIIILPLLMLYHITGLVLNKNALFSSYSQLLSLIPGKTGSYLRCAFFRYVMMKCDQDCVISFATIFSQTDTEIESGTYIGPQCNIGLCKIEKNCLIGSGVHILSGKNQHNFSDINIPIKDQGGSFEKIFIGEDTWIGNGALILANVGKKCVVAAGSVVIKEVPDYTIAAGNPAKQIKQR